MTEISTDARRPRFFYGWLLVVVTIADGAFVSGAGVWGFSVFAIPMGEELGWSRAAIYGALTVRALSAGSLAPFIGPLQDTKRGPRILAVLTVLTLGGSLIAMHWVSDLIVFYVLFGGFGAFASFGSSDMMMTAVLPRWFIRKRARALAIGSTGTAMGPLFFPALVSGLLLVFGWRDAWLVLGLITLSVMGPLALMVRRQPEDIGQLPDGGPATQKEADRESTRRPRSDVIGTDHSFTRRDALRTRCFWLLVFAFALGSFGTGGFFANWIPYFRDLGFTSAEGSMATAAYGVGSITVRAFWVWVTERYPVRLALSVQAIATGLAALSFLFIDSKLTMVVAGGLFGTAVGGFFILRPLAVANYFGRGHLGSINGMIRPFMTVSSAVSPLAVAALYDVTGAYRVSFVIIAACWLTAGLAVSLARPPMAPVTEDVASQVAGS